MTAWVLWGCVTLVPRPYMAIHWTPRYIQPALPVLATMATLGLAHALSFFRVARAVIECLATISMAIMGAAALATVRVVLLQFLAGY